MDWSSGLFVAKTDRALPIERQGASRVGIIYGLIF
jgi:hypothetical protein